MIVTSKRDPSGGDMTNPVESIEAGRVVGAGAYERERRRTRRFRRDEQPNPETTTELPVVSDPSELPAWLSAARDALADGNRYIVFADEGAVRVVPLPVGWSRIGRSSACDIRLDDLTVSRRHALLVHSAGGEVRVLDDRSTNGVELNGSRVEWGTLADGDELAIGRFRLYLVALDPAGSRSLEPALAAD
jgi:hypothetical protein